jgi:hypothetical protein
MRRKKTSTKDVAPEPRERGRAKGHDPTRPIGPGNPPNPATAVVWTAEEDARQLEIVQELWLQYGTRQQIRNALRGEFPTIHDNRVGELFKRVRELAVTQGEDDRKHARELAINAAKRTITSIDVQIAEAKKKGKPFRGWIQTKLAWCRHLADIEGTRAPLDVNVHVNVDLSVTVQAIMATMTADQVAEIVEEERRRDEIVMNAEPRLLSEHSRPDGSAE